MTFPKSHLAAPWLCLAVLIGLIVPAVAQATTEEITSLSVELAAKVEKAANLVFKTKGGTKVEVVCEKLTADNALLEAEGKGSGRLLFGGCLTKLNGTTSPDCKPRVGAETGAIKSNMLKGQIKLHEGATLFRVEPVTGTTLATIELGEECAIGESIPVTGVFYAKESNGALETLKEAHPFEEGPLTSLTALGQPATIAGSTAFNPVGAHVKREWSALGSKPVWLLAVP